MSRFLENGVQRLLENGANRTLEKAEIVAAITTNWGGWGATGIATVGRVATVTTSWTSWNAIAVAGISPQKFATVTTSWASWNATAVANVSPQKFATISTSWTSWNATSIASRYIGGGVTTNWGGWLATADAVVRSLSATIVSNWDVWTATAISTVGRFATITTNWGGTVAYTPAAVPGLVLHLDPAKLGLTDGADVSWWAGGVPIALGAAGPYPKYVADGLNGQPIVRFAPGLTLRWLNTGVQDSWTVIYVGRVIGPSIGRIVTAQYPPTNLLIGYWNGFEDVAYHEGFMAPNTQTTWTGQWRIYSADGIPGGAPLTRFFRNDGIGVTTLLGTQTTGTGWQNTFCLNGYSATGIEETADCEVAEVCLYNRRLTGQERIDVENFLRTKYLTPGGAATGEGSWQASAIGTRGLSATATTDWGGTWAATSILTRTTFAFSTAPWGTWTATAQGEVIPEEIFCTISSLWNSGTAVATALVSHQGFIATTWSTWNATADPCPIQKNATIVSNWGTWTATADPRPILHYGLIATSWTSWLATGFAETVGAARIASDWNGWSAVAVPTVGRAVTVTTNWSSWNAVAVGVLNRPVSIATNWGGWIATSITVPDHPAIGLSTWGPVSLTAIAGVTRVGTITTSWSSWNATSIATPIHVGQAVIFTNWSSWAASAAALRASTMAIATTWPTWSATSIAITTRLATAAISWGTWTATAQAQAIQRNASITTSWGTWTAVASAGVSHFATITQGPGNWVATALGQVGSRKLGTVDTNWSSWNATAVAARGTKATISTTWGGVPVTGPAESMYPEVVTPGGPSDPNTFMLGNQIRIAVDGRIAAIRFYSWGKVTTRYVALWSDAGELLASGNSVNEVFGWNVVPITPVTVFAGQVIRTTHGYKGAPDQFPYANSSGMGSTNLTWLAGVYTTPVPSGGEDDFPTNTITPNHYYTDVVFHADIRVTWVATAIGVAVHVWSATVVTNWSGWSATSIAIPYHPAGTTTNWSSWTATALAQPLTHPARVEADWSSWSAVAISKVQRSALIESQWSAGWVAVAMASLVRNASISEVYTATFEAVCLVTRHARAFGHWGQWTASGFGQVSVRGQTINEADVLYLGDEAVDRVYLDGHLVWELV